MTNPLVRLGRLGQSPWYDYITRDLVTSGELGRLIREDGLLGMTTNPTIFEKAIVGSDVYDADVRRLSSDGCSPAEVVEAVAVADVRAACDLFAPVYQRTGGPDGVVSLEVSPTLAHDTAGTIREAERLWAAVDRPNAMIKIPGTREGLPAVAHCIAAGINVNVTLLFSVARYEEVVAAYEEGLEARAARNRPLEQIASVASFFVSRVDTMVDPLIDRAGGGAGELRGTIATANAALAYRAFRRLAAEDRWTALAARGARAQRPLWASTSTKDPRYADLHYVEPLIAADTVNTMPPETFTAYRDHGRPEIRIDAALAAADERLARLEEAGIDLADVTARLEVEGVKKFAASYESLLKGIESKMEALMVSGER
jgi:transaldolase